ncbi:ArsR/SmtB family transcription factor [Kribbella sp. NPDC048928]|uniref:ArsR/SmtB family transcription factor n=1 Tax=Kribbella sp. NPDC048928 TaxID=3364111 RepID=UPI0037139AB1
MADESATDPFRAIADPTRRRMLELLMERGSLTVGELAAEFPELVTSGISKHLMTLRAAGLVVAVKAGRHQHYRIDDDGLDGAFGSWVAQYEAYWTNALDKLRQLSEEASDDRSGPGSAIRT